MHIKIFFVYALGFVFLLSACERENYLVKNAVDGDTIELEDGRIVRYIGLDTPETRIRREDSTWLYQPEDYAEKAREFNRRLVEGKIVRLEYDMVQVDKYNRVLAYVFAGNIFVNAELIKQGYAMLYTIPPNIKYTELFIKLQKEARENKRGLWEEVSDEPVLPEEAHNYYGRVVYVRGRVLDVYEGKSVIILNFGKEKKDFKAVIFKTNLPIFYKYGVNPVTDYFNKKIKISGKVKKYKKSPEIIIENPSQVEVVPCQ
ncbi:MAG: thermonuclease family protein [bacterium]